MERRLFVQITFVLFYVAFSLQVLFYPLTSIADEEEPLVARELKREVQRSSGFTVQVQVFLNEESNLQDLYITPTGGAPDRPTGKSESVPSVVPADVSTDISAGSSSYSTSAFVFAVAKGVAVITERSITYRLYTGTILIDVNGQLWAISAKSAREVFQLGTVEEQNALLRKKLIRLR